ncbi:hypothetical protein F4823DRAFT_566293 [Ustulina deusta]|nr:hypothetical protein F4823DRAFT_566293 [Ustulina deusta]
MANLADPRYVEQRLVQRNSNARGVGLFTTRSLTAGSLLLNEPLLFDVEGLGAGLLTRVFNEYIQLFDNAKRKYQQLKCNEVVHTPLRSADSSNAMLQHAQERRRVLAIFETNHCAIGDGRYGIFLKFSRLNHSCTPNAFWWYVPEPRMMYVRAMRDLAQGEEVFIGYACTSTMGPYSDRAIRLPFTCKCSTCRSSSRQESDRRRVQIKTLHARLKARVKPVLEGESLLQNYPEPVGINLARAFLFLVREENLYAELVTGYKFLAVFQMRNGRKDEAAQSLSLAEEQDQICRGETD